MNEILGLVQARMSSQRLPGKVLRQACGRRLLDYFFERVSQSRAVKKFLLLTSTDASDDAIASYAREKTIDVFRGPLTNVAERFKLALREHAPRAFVRLSADSPMIDASIIDDVVRLYESGEYDLASNTARRSYPKGQSVEVFKTSTFLEAYPLFSTAEHLEHVTAYFYEHAADFRIAQLWNPSGDHSHESLCVDTEEDLRRFEGVLSHLPKSFGETGWSEFLELSRRTAGAKP